VLARCRTSRKRRHSGSARAEARLRPRPRNTPEAHQRRRAQTAALPGALCERLLELRGHPREEDAARCTLLLAEVLSETLREGPPWLRRPEGSSSPTVPRTHAEVQTPRVDRGGASNGAAASSLRLDGERRSSMPRGDGATPGSGRLPEYGFQSRISRDR